MSEELKKLIDENHGERTFYDGELVGAFFTVKNLENLCLAYACDKLVIKDREIMRLREALEAVMKCEYATTEKEDYILVDDCQCLLVTIEEVRKIKQSLSTPTTYDDLMAWHNEQLGDNVPKGVLQAIDEYGLSLLKTESGFELKKLGKAEAYHFTLRKDK